MSRHVGRGRRLPGGVARLVVVWAGCVAASCKHAPSAKPDAALAAATPEQRARAEAEAAVHDEQAQAQAAYARGKLQLRRGTFADALKTFDDVKTQFPYSPYAALSELAQADTYFREARYLEATDAYRAFLRYHPTHPEARYAAGQVTESLYAQLPSALWFLPPVAEKDPTLLHQVVESSQDYLHRYPAGHGAKRAQQLQKACQQLLADHELYVARFYFRRHQWAGARARALSLLATYPKLKTEPETLWLAGEASHKLGEAAAARTLLDRLVSDYPQAAEAKRARALRRRLGELAQESS